MEAPRPKWHGVRYYVGEMGPDTAVVNRLKGLSGRCRRRNFAMRSVQVSPCWIEEDAARSGAIVGLSGKAEDIRRSLSHAARDARMATQTLNRAQFLFQTFKSNSLFAEFCIASDILVCSF